MKRPLRKSLKFTILSEILSFGSIFALCSNTIIFQLQGMGAIGVYSGKNLVRAALSTLAASADVLAMGQLEVKLSDIPEGKSATFKWRDKPLFIRHRTAAEIEKEQSVDPASLRDPEHDNDRVQKPEWLVVLGICTHLGR